MNATPAPGAALVTGGARRIGRAIALALARDGWAVAIHHRDAGADAERTAAELAAAGARTAVVRADLAREEEAQALVPRAAEALGPLTLLVNNAARFEIDRVDDVTRASWDRHMETNLRAPFVLIQRFAAQLPAGAHGNVVNLLDQRVWNPTPFFMSYTVSKAGLWMLTRTLALALAPRIRVNGIGPGPTLRAERESEQHFARQQAGTPLGRGATPEEIANAVRFIVATPSLTGQMLALDGGQHLNWHPAG
jgi:NAD(P)-dependent dehydrogenase (short-subunit alcohol dehydrogenase family)